MIDRSRFTSSLKCDIDQVLEYDSWGLWPAA